MAKNEALKIIGSKNLRVSREGDDLVLRVDMTKNCGPSKSGKTIVVSTTKGNKDLTSYEGHKIGLNIYKYDDED